MFYVSFILLIILIVLSLTGNLLVILSAVANKKLRKYTHILILNLATSDFLISSFSLTLRLVRLSDTYGLINVPKISTSAFCKYTTCVTITLFASSNFNLLLLTFDRYCAINHALAYKLFFKRYHMFFLIATALILAVVVGAVPAFVEEVLREKSFSNRDSACLFSSVIDPGYNVFITIFTFFAPLIVKIALYISIARKVHSSHTAYDVSRKRNKRIRSSLTRDVIKRRERHMAMGILFLLGAHTALLAPIAILDFVRIFGGIKAPSYAIEICLLLTYTNPVVNAPTYAAASKDYYQTFRNLVCCFGNQSVFEICTKNRTTNENNVSMEHRGRNADGNDIWHISMKKQDSHSL
ncbi:trace amine-associated receptor 6-like [Rhopilema esculentum]|uniref:trace amine-associated receptor 6-like n=1 Tax=Rhopilema esculentum TaxID=499914 RepID=UPI0031DB5E6F|eukprot:gene14433-5490_t